MMTSSNFSLIASAFLSSQFPPANRAEIIMLGRSNVGKSSIINQLAGYGKKRPRDGARVSQTPGCTQSINFYHYRKNTVLVDFPGFGYAKWPEKIKKKVNRLIEDYLYNRPTIAMFIHLVDARLPLQPVDLHMIEWGRKFKTPYLLLLNKCDKLSRQNIKKRQIELEAHMRLFNYCFQILPTSAQTGQGIKELKGRISSVAQDFYQQSIQ